MTLGQKFDTSPFPGSCIAFHIKKPWDCHRNDGKTFAAAISQGFQALVSSLMAASQSASRYASLRDVEAATERFTGSEDIQPHHRLWGPVLSNVAFATGALAPASSVLIRPADASQLEAAAARAMALFPADVFPSAEDTADTLAARLGGWRLRLPRRHPLQERRSRQRRCDEGDQQVEVPAASSQDVVSSGGFLAGPASALSGPDSALCIHSVWPEAVGLAIISHADGSLRV